MTTIFIDTSALLAILDADDDHHGSASQEWERLILGSDRLVCTNYILVETFALVQRRLGMDAVRKLYEDILPMLVIDWMDADSHATSVAALVISGRRGLSLVDCASFETMRRLGLDTAFAFDRHFGEQEFHTLPQE
ncbi:MAG: PIN domain-containing protein [Chloroflexota bacterium]|nr:PIN domain-containing protein [Chloroflexota bacterium]TET33432.1 MAG: PIN domain-containing protein [Anaerolineales bacterium]